MCKYFSCIIDKNLKVLWSKASMSHEDIIADAKLSDTKLVNRDFVRIEITPCDYDHVTRNKKDWILSVDEEVTLPSWFTDARKKCERLCWAAWKKSIKINLAVGTEVLEVEDCYVVAHDSSKVKAYGSSIVKAHDSSIVVAHDSSIVEAHDYSEVEALNSSEVVAHGSSKVVAHDYSKVVAHGSSKVVAHDYSEVEALNSSEVVALNSSKVKAHGSSEVVARDHVVVHQYSGDAKITLQSSMAVIIDHIAHKIRVLDIRDVEEI